MFALVTLKQKKSVTSGSFVRMTFRHLRTFKIPELRANLKNWEATMKQRVRNSPPMREIIRGYMIKKGNAVSFEEIFIHVSKSATLLGKTPRNSVFSVLTRISDIERVGPAMYKLKNK
jgi:hypothetical protein